MASFDYQYVVERCHLVYIVNNTNTLYIVSYETYYIFVLDKSIHRWPWDQPYNEDDDDDRVDRHRRLRFGAKSLPFTVNNRKYGAIQLAQKKQ